MSKQLSFFENILLEIFNKLSPDEQIRLLHIATALLPEDEVQVDSLWMLHSVDFIDKKNNTK